jgi:Mg/Co/Ni transporter MgtE
MAIHATQAHLVRKYIRAADGKRISRLLDRLPVESLAELFGQLNEREMRRIATSVSADDEIANTLTSYGDEALLMLLEVAEEDDACRLVRQLESGRANRLIRRLDEARAHTLMGVLKSVAQTPATKSEMRNILRMRRLFA